MYTGRKKIDDPINIYVIHEARREEINDFKSSF